MWRRKFASRSFRFSGNHMPKKMSRRDAQRKAEAQQRILLKNVAYQLGRDPTFNQMAWSWIQQNVGLVNQILYFNPELQDIFFGDGAATLRELHEGNATMNGGALGDRLLTAIATIQDEPQKYGFTGPHQVAEMLDQVAPFPMPDHLGQPISWHNALETM